MKKYFTLLIVCALAFGTNSCASSKKNKEATTKEQRKKEQEEKKLAQEKAKTATEVVESPKGPVVNKRTETAPRLLETK